MSEQPGMSVVIPAHNEAVVLPRLLRELRTDAGISVIVSANACSDDTATLARAAASASDGVRVVETDVPSKAVALNAGDAIAGDRFPRAYVDADVLVSAATLLALADVLRKEGGPLVAAPRLRVDTSASSWAARAHYRIWELSDYRRAGHVGSGIYALSAEGRARFGAFPDVIADDRFVQQLFGPSERLTIDEEFVVRAPATLRAHIRRATRIAAGNRQLHRRAEVARGAGVPGRDPMPGDGTHASAATLSDGTPSSAAAATRRFGRKNAGASHPYTADPPIHLPKPTTGPTPGTAAPIPGPANGGAPAAQLPQPSAASGYRNLVARVAPHPTLWPSFLVYCVGYGVPLLLATLSERRGRLPGWNRDETSRA